MTGTKATIDHDEIQEWAEERGAHPARVKRTGRRGDIGMIRLDFPGYSGAQSLEPISWDQFFEKFDESNLALIYRESTPRGARSNFNKLVGRETVDIRRGVGRKVGMPRRHARTGAKRVSRGTTSRTSSRRARSRRTS
jgi:hypothetical protein